MRSNGIESYELYWILSLIDYYEYSGDAAGAESLLSEATARLDHAYEIYGTHPSLSFFGWDERLGAGFENPDLEENQHSYQLLAIQAWKDFSQVLEALGHIDLAERYRGYAAEKTAGLRLIRIFIRHTDFTPRRMRSMPVCWRMWRNCTTRTFRTG